MFTLLSAKTSLVYIPECPCPQNFVVYFRALLYFSLRIALFILQHLALLFLISAKHLNFPFASQASSPHLIPTFIYCIFFSTLILHTYSYFSMFLPLLFCLLLFGNFHVFFIFFLRYFRIIFSLISECYCDIYSRQTGLVNRIFT